MERHTIHYEVMNSQQQAESGRHWAIDVQATPKELQTFAETGYLIREGLFAGALLQQLRDALDRLEARESEKRDSAVQGERSWGFIPRHLMDKDEVFLGLRNPSG